MFVIKRVEKRDQGYNYFRGLLQGTPLYGKKDGAERFDTRIQAQNRLYDIKRVGEELAVEEV